MFTVNYPRWCVSQLWKSYSIIPPHLPSDQLQILAEYYSGASLFYIYIWWNPEFSILDSNYWFNTKSINFGHLNTSSLDTLNINQLNKWNWTESRGLSRRCVKYPARLEGFYNDYIYFEKFLEDDALKDQRNCSNRLWSS